MIGCFFVTVVTDETLAQWKADAEFVDVEFSPDPAEGMWPRMGETHLGCPSEIQLDFTQEGNPVKLNMELNTDLLEQEHSAVNFRDGTETKADTVSISTTLCGPLISTRLHKEEFQSLFLFGHNLHLQSLTCYYNDFVDEGEIVFDKNDGSLKIQGEFVSTEGTWALESVDGYEETNFDEKPFKIFKISESKIVMQKFQHSF